MKADKDVNLDLIAQGVRLILEGIGEDLERPGLQGTPQRVAEMYAELTSGMREDPQQHVLPLPGDKHDEMVIVKDISIASLCEHHLAPFVGRCHIAYIPKGGRILGISKLARIAEAFSRRLQLQERLTTDIANTLFEGLKPLGVMVVIGLHLVTAYRERRQDRPARAATDAAAWVDACAVDDIPNDRARTVCLDGRERIAIFRYDGKVSAVTNVCAHQRGPLGEGKIIDGCIEDTAALANTCPET